jgi:hypothetical protein
MSRGIMDERKGCHTNGQQINFDLIRNPLGPMYIELSVCNSDIIDARYKIQNISYKVPYTIYEVQDTGNKIRGT